MNTIEALKGRRTYYNINDKLPVSTDEIVKTVKEITELVPDSFNMKSSRVIVALGDQHKKLWDAIFDVFGGKVAREKIDSFKAGAGTILYFVDNVTVGNLQGQFPMYAERFPHWAAQSAGMLQISIWEALRELNVGASLQHYNPLIDDEVRRTWNLPESWMLIAEMPFGTPTAEPGEKEFGELSERIKIFR
mgnify:CR=1 FL=1